MNFSASLTPFTLPPSYFPHPKGDICGAREKSPCFAIRPIQLFSFSPIIYYFSGIFKKFKYIFECTFCQSSLLGSRLLPLARKHMTKAKGGANKKNTELGEGEKRRCEKKTKHPTAALNSRGKNGEGRRAGGAILSHLACPWRERKKIFCLSRFFFCAVLANYIIAPMSVSRPCILSAATTVSDLNKSKVCEKFANLP